MIPQIEPWIDHSELVELERVVKSRFVVEHELTKEFEAMTKELTGAKHAIAMTNGTAALYCCLKAVGVGPGDEVIVPDMTFIATANAVIMAGATPIFCDVLEDTFCLNPALAEKLITPRTKVIMPVHLYGQSADMDQILALAKKYKLRVIEDAAQGVGVFFNNQHVGTFGDLGILSYYGNKTITCGEGGVVLTNDDALATACYRLKNHGRDKKGIFIHEQVGFNFSFTEMQAAIGISQMKKLSRIIEKKKSIHATYTQRLKGVGSLQPAFIDSRTKPVFWFTSYLCKEVEPLAKFMLEKGIQTRRFFYPLHQQPCYQDLLTPTSTFPVSSRIYQMGISLPSSYGITDDQLNYVCDTLCEFYQAR